MSTIFHDWSLAKQGADGISSIRQGLLSWQATGAGLALPIYLAFLVEAYGQVGQEEEGLRTLAEALATVDRTGERMYEAELYRLKGELTLQRFQVPGLKFQVQDAQQESEICFSKALEVALSQAAKSWELRAATSLARLWQQQGKRKEAHEMLSEIYGWFMEGFDTKDLQEAKGLLEELTV
jgi:predicted ATPase